MVLLSIISKVEMVSFAFAVALADFALSSIRLDSSTVRSEDQPMLCFPRLARRRLTEEVEDGVGNRDT
jgi:hypothetical protein